MQWLLFWVLPQLEILCLQIYISDNANNSRTLELVWSAMEWISSVGCAAAALVVFFTGNNAFALACVALPMIAQYAAKKRQQAALRTVRTKCDHDAPFFDKYCFRNMSLSVQHLNNKYTRWWYLRSYTLALSLI